MSISLALSFFIFSMHCGQDFAGAQKCGFSFGLVWFGSVLFFLLFMPVGTISIACRLMMQRITHYIYKPSIIPQMFGLLDLTVYVN